MFCWERAPSYAPHLRGCEHIRVATQIISRWRDPLKIIHPYGESGPQAERTDEAVEVTEDQIIAIFRKQEGS